MDMDATVDYISRNLGSNLGRDMYLFFMTFFRPIKFHEKSISYATNEQMMTK